MLGAKLSCKSVTDSAVAFNYWKSLDYPTYYCRCCPLAENCPPSVRLTPPPLAWINDRLFLNYPFIGYCYAFFGVDYFPPPFRSEALAWSRLPKNYGSVDEVVAEFSDDLAAIISDSDS